MMRTVSKWLTASMILHLTFYACQSEEAPAPSSRSTEHGEVEVDSENSHATPQGRPASPSTPAEDNSGQESRLLLQWLVEVSSVERRHLEELITELTPSGEPLVGEMHSFSQQSGERYLLLRVSRHAAREVVIAYVIGKAVRRDNMPKLRGNRFLGQASAAMGK